ncbi:hypothetical protein F5Y03DRAFT_398852 [Xylaria venustula]|nr:hypothetical protein F5Y03DRAFT_398852 [Xylaria venustula]
MIYALLLTVPSWSHRYIDGEENTLVAIEQGGSPSANFLCADDDSYLPSDAVLHGNILRTCKQINVEATAVLYSNNTFVTCVHFANLLKLSSIQHTLNQLQLDLIRSFSLVFRSGGWPELVLQVDVVSPLLAKMVRLKRLELSIILMDDSLALMREPVTWTLIGRAVTSVLPGVEVVAVDEFGLREDRGEGTFIHEPIQWMINDIQAYASRHGKNKLSFEDYKELAVMYRPKRLV